MRKKVVSKNVVVAIENPLIRLVEPLLLAVHDIEESMNLLQFVARLDEFVDVLAIVA